MAVDHEADHVVTVDREVDHVLEADLDDVPDQEADLHLEGMIQSLSTNTQSVKC